MKIQNIILTSLFSFLIVSWNSVFSENFGGEGLEIISSDSVTSSTVAPTPSPQPDGSVIVWNNVIVNGQVSSSVIAQPIDDRNEMDKASDAYNAAKSASSSSPGPIKVYTTEKIPGAECECAIDNRDARDRQNGMTLESQCGDIKTRKYVCTVQPWLGSFQSMFRDIIKYFVNIVLILWVLAIVGLGIAWSFSWGDDAKAKSTLKKWGINILVGLIILFMFQYILRFLAPWIYK